MTQAPKLTSASEIIFIDRGVSAVSDLLSGLRPDVEPVLLDSERSAISQIAEALEQRTGIETVHVVAHGRAGEVSFTSGAVSLENLNGFEDELSTIGQALSAGGEMLLWSCHTGAGARGSRFVAALADATGVSVAASSGLIGAAAKGGDWQLATRAVRAPLTAAGIAAYQGVMTNDPVITSISVATGHLIISGTAANSDKWTVGLYDAAAGHDVVVGTNPVAGTINNGVGTIAVVKGASAGTWTVDLGAWPAVSSTYPAGTVFGAVAWNNTGNANAPSSTSGTDLTTTQPASIKVLGTAPPAPVVTNITPDHGTSTTDGITDTNPVAISGTAEAGSTVKVYEAGNLVDTVTADATGHWTTPTNVTLANGSNSLTATATNAIGTSPTSTAFVAIYDNDGPATVLAGSNTGYVNAAQASAASLTVSGLDPDDTGTVTFTDSANHSVTVNITGGSAPSTVDVHTLADGVINVQVDVSDVAGNHRTPSSSFKLDTTVAAPSVGLVNDTGSSQSDGITNVGALSVSGETGATFSYSTDGGSTWSNSFSATEGLNTVKVKQTDLAGNTSAATTFSFTLDTGADDHLTLSVNGKDPAHVSATLGGNVSDVNGTITVTDGHGTTKTLTVTNGVTQGTADLTGYDGADLTASFSGTDTAGNNLNVSAPAFNWGLTHDTGISSTDGITNDDHFSGTVTPGSTVEVYLANGTDIGPATVDAAGNWTYTPPAIPDGTYSVYVTATDAGGNKTTAGSTFTLDTGANDHLTLSVNGTDPAHVSATLGGDVGDINGTITVTDGHGTTKTLTVTNGVTQGTANLTGYDGADLTASFSGTDIAGNNLSKSAPAFNWGLTNDTGFSATDGLTNDDHFSGTVTPGSTVEVYLGANPLGLPVGTDLGPATVDGAGNWTYTPPAVPDGTYSVYVTATDAGGNKTTAGSTFTLDTHGPTTDIHLSNDTGKSGSDKITKDGSLTSGATDANGVATSSVTIKDSGNNTVANATADGTYTATISATDNAGNSSSSSVTFTVDNTGPTTDIHLTNDSGSSSSDKLTNDATLTSSATDANGIDTSSVTIKDSGNNTVGSVTADGTYTATISATDVAGNSSSSSVTFTYDHTGPTTDIHLSNDTGKSGSDKITKDGSLTSSATDANGVATSSVTIKDSGNNTVANATADGTYTATISATDNAGNSSSSSVTFTVDNTGPTTSISLTNDSGKSNSDKLTNDATLTSSATDTNGIDTSSVTIKDSGNNTVGSVTADGTYTATISATDVAGNTSSSSVTFTYDHTGPTTTASITDTGHSDATPVTSANSVSVSASDTNGIDTFKAYVDGSATGVDVTGPSFDVSGLSQGAHTIKFTATDMAGNSTDKTVSFIRDTVNPTATASIVDSGPQDPNHVTNANSVSVSTSDANPYTFKAFIDGSATGVDVSGTSFDISGLSQGHHTITFTATDLAGNSNSASVDFVRDTINPNKTVISTISDPVGGGSVSQTYIKTSPLPLNTDAFSTTGNVTIKGLGEAGTTITLWDNNHSTVYATTTVDSNGNWAVVTGSSGAATLAAGNHSFQAVQTDLAGNVSANSNTFNVIVNPNAALGGSGADTIYANLAPNGATLTGGSGNDTFTFYAKGFGADTVSDFSSGDVLSFSKSVFTDLAHLTITQSGSSAVITDGLAGDSITILNTKISALTTKNVLFV